MILVTGSRGHLGEALLRTLRAAGRPARGLDRLPSPYTDHVGDLAERAFVASCMDGITAVLHTATLHKPHVDTHARQAFVDTNVTGTLNLLEEAAAAKLQAFVFTSTTSTFGGALVPPPGQPAAWITEDVVPVPKNIYGVTKVAAESLCELFHRMQKLPVIVLRTSRFFPEDDDDATMRARYTNANAQANELLYRRVDLQDCVDAHLAALTHAPRLGFGRYIVSATTPFTQRDLPALRSDAVALVQQLFPDCARLYATHDWRLLPTLDRVYDNAAARAALGWTPRHDFQHALDCLARGEDFRSELARTIGAKGYHARA